ncbi:hypothetical protein DVH05_004912 [Phytophthora capsici]|nr:hypothetical protein DVH05_004912 [Phytophthora capsici]
MTQKTRRTYRPFSATEDQALVEGVEKYNGQRKVWSLILLDKELGPLFNDRSNIQLRSRFHTMRHAATASALLVKDKRLPASNKRLRKSQAIKSTTTQDREKSGQPQAQAKLANSQPQASANATQVDLQQQAYLQQYEKLQKQIQRRQLQQQQQQLAAAIAATSKSSQQLQK